VRETSAKSACAGSRDAVSLLASFLYFQAGKESVRTREAVAATIVNQVNGLLRAHGVAAPTSPALRSLRARLFIERLDRLGSFEVTRPRTEEPAFASCWRIANRAVSGALQDPTGGAVRYHELGASPTWATSLNPRACIGSYLFYDDLCYEEDRNSPAGTESASGPPAGAQATTESRG
jgi:cell wall hydrolase